MLALGVGTRVETAAGQGRSGVTGAGRMPCDRREWGEQSVWQGVKEVFG